MAEQTFIQLKEEDLVGGQIWKTDHVTNREPNQENLTGILQRKSNILFQAHYYLSCAYNHKMFSPHLG